jgi:hypothetical protein
MITKAAIQIWFEMLPLPIQDFSCLMQREFNSGKHTAYALNEDINTFA